MFSFSLSERIFPNVFHYVMAIGVSWQLIMYVLIKQLPYSGGSRGHPLCLDQNEARGAEKKIFETWPLPPYLRVWMTATTPPSPYR